MATGKPLIVIAVDGPSGTGKSTTARLVAQALGITYIDTGAMYRAVAWKALQAGIPASSPQALLQLMQTTSIGFDAANQITVDGVDRSAEIRTLQVSNTVSSVSAVLQVREALTAQQRRIGAAQSCTMDGRDIGTVVFPDAAYKFFLVANYRVRAERRLAEMLAKGITASLEEVEHNLRERDEADSSRTIAPLRKAEDAVEIDTTQLTIEQQVECILRHAGVVAWRQMSSSTTQGKQ